jgi:hypothetical protein
MSLSIGRLALDDPEAFPESVGEGVSRVGSTPVPGGRSGISTSLGLTSFSATFNDTPANRERNRRQLRSLLNNLTMKLQGVYINWSEDTEQNGWYVPGTATFDVAGSGALDSAFWRFTSVSMDLVGRPRTHRRAVSFYVRDLRASTTPKDYLKRVYGTDFSGLTPIGLLWLPSNVSDVLLASGNTASLIGPRTGYGSASLYGVVSPTDLDVAHFEQAEANVHKGDVVVYDRRGQTAVLTTGPNTDWEEVYGPDWPWSASDVSVIENSLCRVRYLSTNTPGFAIDVWTGSAWSEQGKVLIQRLADATGFLNTLVSADLAEWSPDRGVVRVVMQNNADNNSREEIYITLQRGWTGPRFEVYPAKTSAGAKAQSSIHLYSFSAGANGDSAIKVDASTTGNVSTAGSGSTSFSAGAIGAATFTGENWVAFLRAGQSYSVYMAAVKADGAGRAESGTDAYGSARNGIAILSAAAAGYVSAHIGFGAQVADQGMEAESMTLGAGTSSTADGAASNGNAATTTRTTDANAHVTKATWPNNARGKYRIFARVKTSASTLNIYAKTTATTGSTKTTSSASYVWLDLGDIVADGSTLEIHVWSAGAATKSLDRIEAIPVEGRLATTVLYDGVRDLGVNILYDTRASQSIVSR